jgi:hypothetical protein
VVLATASAGRGRGGGITRGGVHNRSIYAGFGGNEEEDYN